MVDNKVVRGFTIDFLSLACVWLPVLLVFLVGEPFRRGFFCDDTSIRHPYREDTIPDYALVIGSFGIPVVAIVAVELVRSRQRRIVSDSNKPDEGCRSFNPAPVVVEIFHTVAVFLFGAGCSQLTTDIAKYSVGRLRPHFIALCNPLNLDAICNGLLGGLYQEDFICQASDVKKLRESRLSFPSGHASFSAYTMVYLALYLQARMTWSGSRLLRPFLQLAALMLTWYTGLSRVSDYKHHWSDVLAGFLIGTVAASLTALYISTLFKLKATAGEARHDLISRTGDDVDLRTMDSPRAV